MAKASIIQNAFLGGQIPESLRGRIDNPVYKYGFSEGINVDITPQGSLTKRNGLKYVWSSDDSSLTSVRWIPYRIADGRTLLFLVTPTKFLAFLEGELTVGPGNVSPAEVNTNGWSEHTQLNPQTNIRYVQVGDSLYLCRPTHPTVRLQISFNADGELLLDWSIVKFRSGQEPRLRKELSAFGLGTKLLYVSQAGPRRGEVSTLNTVKDSLDYTFIKSISNIIPQVTGTGRRIGAVTYKNETLYILLITSSQRDSAVRGVELLGVNLIRDDFAITKFRDIATTRIDGEVVVPGNLASSSNIFFVGDDFYMNSGQHLWKLDPTATDPAQGEFIRDLDFNPAKTLFYFDNRFWYFKNFTQPNNLQSFRLGDASETTNTWTFDNAAGFDASNGLANISTNGEDIYVFIKTRARLLRMELFASSNSYTVVKQIAGNTAGSETQNFVFVFDENESKDRITKLDLENFGFSAISYYQGRLALAGHPQIPNAVFLSDINKFNVFSDNSDFGLDQVLDSDALFLQIAQGPDSGVHSLKSWQDRLIMNSVWGVYQLKPPFNTTTGSVTPTSFEIRFSSQIGASFEVDSVLTEEGLIYPDNNSTAIFRYDYKDESDIYSATAISNTIKGVNDKKVVGLEYTSGATSILLVDTIDPKINSSIAPREEISRDLRNLIRIIYDESEGQLAASEYVLPEQWVGLGSFYPVGNNIYFSMIGRPVGADASRDRFIVGYIDGAEQTEFDFSISHRATNPFSTINTGLGWLGTGTEVILKVRQYAETSPGVRPPPSIHRGTINASGGFTPNAGQGFSNALWIEVGLGFKAYINSNDLTIQATRQNPTNFGSISSVNKAFIELNNKTDYFVDVNEMIGAKIPFGPSRPGEEPDRFINDRRELKTTRNDPYWLDTGLGLGSISTRSPRLNITIGEENKIELLALKIEVEVSNM